MEVTKRQKRKSGLQTKDNIINILLFIATIILIWSTLSLNDTTGKLNNETRELVNTTANLNNLESNLFLERQKIEVISQITLAEDLLLETEKNRNEFNKSISTLPSKKNNTEFPVDYFETTKIEQARNTNGFGSKTMREKFMQYSNAVDLTKFLYSKISLQDQYKGEYIDDALHIAEGITRKNGNYDGVNIDEFISDINDYIKERNDYLAQIDLKLKIAVDDTTP